MDHINDIISTDDVLNKSFIRDEHIKRIITYLNSYLIDKASVFMKKKSRIFYIDFLQFYVYNELRLTHLPRAETIEITQEFRRILVNDVIPLYRQKGWKVEFETKKDPQGLKREGLRFTIQNNTENIEDVTRADLIDLDED